MLQEIIDLLPEKVVQMPVGLAMGIAAGGVVLGLVEARASRSILALTLVAAGTIIGLHMPAWFGWKIDPMGTAFGAAILLGLSGFVLNMLWEAVLLGGLLGAGGGLAVWMTLGAGASWQLPDIDWSGTAIEIGTKIWQSIPPSVMPVLPGAVILGFAIGVSLLAAWPGLGRALLYSLLGISLFTVCGAVGLQQRDPDQLAGIPKDNLIQWVIFGSIVLAATAVQWIFVPRPKKQPTPPPANEDDLEEGTALEGAWPPPARPRVTPPPPPAPRRTPPDPNRASSLSQDRFREKR